MQERAVRALHPDDAFRAGNLWSTLVELALQVAASGGDRTREGLIEHLRRQSFRFAGDQRHSSARAALAEASRHALAEISVRVGHVMLTRPDHIAAVQAAFDSGRYIEIRGDAGVGKSGVLKHFAEQIATEAPVVVLSPNRTIPNGWTSMRAVLGFDGTARDLLIDLEGAGGAILFIDNLDFFSEAERRTVVDLVREAASIPDFAVIVTARSNFGIVEPNWLPSDALDRLGRAEPIFVSELSEAEVEEIRYAAPLLVPLLADTHPAREITRNLFRLARLASRQGNEAISRTEVDMAEQWWQTADGKTDGDYRERARLLKALAEQALSRTEPLDVTDRPARVVDALVASESLRDLGNDRVAFRHDVLREWAIANLLYSDSTIIERLPLERPASVALARGVELASRMILERAVDMARWQSFVERLSREGTHRSWRRAVLLALVRSEIGLELLTRAAGLLFANRGNMLRELIRTVMAVEVEPASKRFEAIGVDPSIIPALNVPSSPSWHRLISWLLSLGEALPKSAIPDVVDLYSMWPLGTFGFDPLTPLLMQQVYRWLTEVEATHEMLTFRQPFGGEIDPDRIRSLESDLRTSFLLFSNRTPTLAKQYLRSLIQREHSEEIVRSIFNFRGSLAQAAPEELAELTATALIPQHQSDSRRNRRRLRELDGPFGFLDDEFLPESPAQGPFFELLTHAPQHGLSLVRRLVDHAISFYSGGGDYGTNAITIPFAEGDRNFPWTQSYVWSRESSGNYSVTSALMALESWAHSRIEAGEAFEQVLADVLGPPGSPAAYLLVAVDLLISHWPKSREASVPFLSSPELLCLDGERYVHDRYEYPDFFGLKALQKEPAGTVSIENLKKRASRQHSLKDFLPYYAHGPVDSRERISALLRRAVARLGPPDEQSNLGDPAFMVLHALNLIDPNNWRERLATLAVGTQETVSEYVPPDAETQHLTPLIDAVRDRHADADMELALGTALVDPSRSSPRFATVAVEWAQSKNVTCGDEQKDPARKEAIVTAAMIVMRDGDAELQAQHVEWARGVFAEALQTKEDSVHRFRGGLRFNPIAIAFAGIVHLLKGYTAGDDVRSLLEVAARGDPAAAHGFGPTAAALASIDEGLPRALLRCAFTACIRRRHEWNLPEDEIAARSEHHRQRVQAAVDAELAWFAGQRAEPNWPAFPAEAVRRRTFIRIGDQSHTNIPLRPQPDEYTDHQAAALWLAQTRSFFGVSDRPWLLDLARAYVVWTAHANGAGLGADEEIAHPPREWNNAYYDLIAHCLPDLAWPAIEQLALVPISSLPEEPFFDILTLFLRSVDTVYFDNVGVQENVASGIRSAVADRLMTSSGWKRLGRSRSASIERHIGPAIAILFFNDYSSFEPAKCYLLPIAIDRLGPFLPMLEKLIESGPSLFVAIVTLNLLEVSPRSGHLRFMVTAAMTWLNSYPNDSEFWVDHGIGRRVCVWIEKVRPQDPSLLDEDKPIRFQIDRLLAALITLGVSDATRLEEALAGGSGSGA